MLPSSRALPALLLIATATAAVPSSAETLISLIAIPEEGLWGPDLERIESGFRNKVPELGDFVVQDKSETVEHFSEARSLGIDCRQNDVDCATKIGVIGGADKVLLLRAASREGAFFLTLLVVDVADPSNAKRVTQFAPTAGIEHDRAIEEAAVRLFAPERHKGAVRVLVNPPGAQISLDGAALPERGVGGVVDGISVGDHQVAVTLAGYRSVERAVQVRFKETSELRIELTADPSGQTGTTTTTTTTTTPTAETTTGGDPSERTPPPDEDGSRATPTTSEDPAQGGLGVSPFVLGGGIAAGVGVAGVLVGAGMTGYGVVTAGDRGLTVDERRGAQTVGIAGLTVAVLSGAVVVTGAAAMAWGLVEPAPVE